MTTQPSPPGPVVTTDTPRVPSTRLSGRCLVRARIAWAALACLLVALNAGFLSAYWTGLHTICAGARCSEIQPTPASILALRAIGLSVTSYARLTLAVISLSTLVCLVLAGVIVWRKSDDWMALVTALAVVVLGTVLVPNQLEQSRSAWQLLAFIVDVINFTLLLLFASLFPSGRLVPRWIRWLVLGWAAAGGLLIIALGATGELWISVYEAIWLGTMAGAVVAQVYRYRAVSGERERAQTRWVVFGGSVAIAMAMAVTAPQLLLPGLVPHGSLFHLLVPLVGALATLLLAVSIGMAILRHHLYEIDVIIRRTLIYSLVIGVLGTIYALSTFLLQTGFEAVTRQGSPLAVVGSTLAITALFVPIRSRVQAVVDRRFYRRRYNAARTLAAFGHTLQRDVDLARLTDHLLAVVEETMQPSRVSLWMARPARPAPSPQGQSSPWSLVDASEAAAARLPKPVPLTSLFTSPEGPHE